MKIPRLGTRRLLVIAFPALVTLLIAGELTCRFVLGLGNVPLSVTHPRIEYMFKPDQDLRPFRNHVHINHYGMRSEDFPARKRDPSEFRIMVFGDSVINGGNLTDQKDLATVILQRKLEETLSRKVIVGNISAGSWGPGNWLGYANTYGLFDADIVIVVLSSHDASDNPTFEPLNQNIHPTRRVWSALWEGLCRYLPRYLPGPRQKTANSESSEDPSLHLAGEREAVAQGTGGLRQLLLLSKKMSTLVLVFQYLEQIELLRNFKKDGFYQIRQVCAELDVPAFSFEKEFRASVSSGINPYRDAVHPNAGGQRLMAEPIYRAVLSILNPSGGSSGPTPKPTEPVPGG